MNLDPLDQALQTMRDLYGADPSKAVRGQRFIKALHGYLASQIRARLAARPFIDHVVGA